MIQAFPEDTAPRFLVRDRDKIYGERFRHTMDVLGIEEIVTAARSPWQNAYAEWLIGSLRRECLDHLIVLDEVHLRRILGKHFEYYNRTAAIYHWSTTPRSLEKVQGPEVGDVVEPPRSWRAPPSIRTSGGMTRQGRFE